MNAVAPAFALVLTLAGAMAHADPRAVEIDDLLQRAERFLSRQVRHEREAIPLFMRAERLARAAGDRPRVARALAGLGSAQLSIHQYAESESTLLRARELARSIDLYEVEARTVRLLATLFSERGDFTRAIALQTELLQLATRHHDLMSVAGAHNNMAATLRRQGNPLRATQEAARAIAILDGIRERMTLVSSSPHLIFAGALSSSSASIRRRCSICNGR
jgi:tetratricopeptide (TPR) repeat protein